MSENIHLYSAYFSKEKEKYIFEIREITIKKVWKDGTIQAEYPYFISKDYSTSFFGGNSGNEINKEYSLYYGKAYYSTDKEKCMEWLEEKQKAELEKIQKEYYAIQSSKIADKGVDKIS